MSFLFVVNIKQKRKSLKLGHRLKKKKTKIERGKEKWEGSGRETKWRGNEKAQKKQINLFILFHLLGHKLRLFSFSVLFSVSLLTLPKNFFSPSNPPPPGLPLFLTQKKKWKKNSQMECFYFPRSFSPR